MDMKQATHKEMSLDEEIRQLQSADKKRILSVSNIKEKGSQLKLKNKPRAKQLVIGSLVLLFVLQPIFIYLVNRDEEVKAASTTVTLRPNGDNTTGWQLCTNAACGGTAHYTLVDESSANDADYVNTGTGGTTGETDSYNMEDPTVNGTFVATTSVAVKWRANVVTCLGNSTNCDSISVNIFINGALQTAQTVSMTTTITDRTTTFNGSWAAINDLRIQFVRNRVGGGSAASADDDTRLYQAYADVTYSYNKVTPQLTQKGYIWEMDDATGDSASQLAAGNTAITMRAGERATLRAQVRNTGGPVDTENFGLFYDRNDNVWAKVKNFEKKTVAGGNCDTYDTGAAGSDDWQCTVVDNQTAGVGTYSSLAISPISGMPYVAYVNSTDGSVVVANYVGSNGNCDTYGTGSAGSDAWQCTIVDNQTASIGTNLTIAFSPAGVPYVSYIGNSAALIVANYVGNAGNCDTYATGSAGSDAWQCTIVDDQTDTIGSYTSMSFSQTGTPYVAYRNTTDGSVIVAASRNGTAGGNCDTYGTGSTGSDFWDCTLVDDQTDTVGADVSLAFSPSNIPYVSYQNVTDNSLVVAKLRTSAGGNCDTYATGSTGSDFWDCTLVDDQTGITGQYSSFAFSPDGTPYVSYQSAAAGATIVANLRSSGSGGNCDTYASGSTGSDAWDCVIVDDQTDVVGFATSLVFSPGGTPYVSYFNITDDSIIVAYYVGSGGNCSSYAAGSSGSSAWQCTVVDDQTDDLGDNTSLAFSPNGTPYISYYHVGDSALIVANLIRQGEILISPSYGGTASFTNTHVDMTSTSDSTAKNNNTCQTSGTFNTGKYFLGEEGSGLSIADGSGAAQCTEVSWTIDTSQAVPGTTYRFVIATNDAFNQSKSKWRGPIGIDNYPTLTIEDDSKYDTHQTVSKDSFYTLPDCTDTNWGCGYLDADTDATGYNQSMGISPSGKAYVVYRDITLSALMIAEYVGSGGSGCGASGSTAWICTALYKDAVGSAGDASLAFGPTGAPYVSFNELNSTSLMIAQYVGSGGSGCGDSGSAAWSCTTVDNDTDNTGSSSSLAFSPTGVPSISYADDTASSLMIAQYVGSGGSGCGSSGSAAWSCTTVDNDTDSTGGNSSLAFSPNGTPYISYIDTSVGGVWIAQYVGSGGSGCGSSGSAAWKCVLVHNQSPSQQGLAFSPSGVPYLLYAPSSGGDALIAQYVGGGTGSGCTSSDWTCTVIYDDASASVIPKGLVFNAMGTPYAALSGTSASALIVAKYVGSGGSGCGSNATGAWTCTTVDNLADEGSYASIAIGPDGNPWVSYHEHDPDYNLKIAVYKGSQGPPTYSITNTPSSRNGRTSYGRYALSGGKPSGSTSTTCTATANFLGLCGIAQEDGQYETMAAPANHRPMFQMRSRFNNNSVMPTFTWAGQSSVAASTSNITLQVYRYGSTNAWETIATNSTCAASTPCVVNATPTGTLSEYFQADGSNYWTYFRVVQAAHTSSVTTMKTDMLKAVQSQQQMRHGRTFNRDLSQPFDTEQR